MSISFQEKSLWLMLAGLVGCFGFYFYVAWATLSLVNSSNVLPHHVALFGVTIVLLVVFQIIGHILIAVFDRRSETDERDRLIGLKGTRNAAYVLAAGVFLALCAALITRGNFVFIHVLLASWVLAQMVEIVTQLVLYRRGV